MINKNIAVVFSITKNLLFAVANVIHGIEKHSPNFVDQYIIFLDSFESKNDMDILRGIGHGKVAFELFDTKQYKQNANINQNLPKYSIMCFGLFECIRYLEKYRFVIFLDPDLLVQNDISGIISKSYVKMASGRLTIEEALGRKISNEQLKNKKACNSGVVVFNSKISELIELKTLYSDCVSFANSYLNTLVFPDQAVINLVLGIHQIPIDKLDWKYNSMIQSKGLFYASAIVHSVGGKSKYWNNGVTNLMFPEWNANHQKWLNLGGSDYAGPRFFWKVREYSKKELFEVFKFAINHGFKI